MDLNAHIEYLAQSHNMRLLDEREAAMHRIVESLSKESLAPMIYCNSFSAVHAITGETVYYIDPDESDDPVKLYFIALHEIGHQVLGHRNSEQEIEQVVENEIEAWAWAFEKSIIEPTDDVYMDMMNSLGTYTDDLYKVGAFKKKS